MRTALILLGMMASAFAESREVRAGQPLVLTDLYIPGGAVEPTPRRDRTPPLVVRLLETKPAQDGHRYDFEITGLDPGTHDLADFLTAVNPADAPDMPEILLEITSGLPEGIVLPSELPPAEIPALGGYKTKMIAAAAVWCAGLVAMVVWIRRKKSGATISSEHVATLAERLQPLLERAASGNLDDAGRASLERLVIGRWREKLPEISALPPAEAMVKLRVHPEASPLILQLERWLHAREGNVSAADLEALLAPYR